MTPPLRLLRVALPMALAGWPSSSGTALVAPVPVPASAVGGNLGYAIGADLSFLAQAEAGETKFKDGGVAKPGLQIFCEHGCNWRLAEYRDKPAPFPEFPEGQREFLEEVNRPVLAKPGGLGKGIFWWEPAVTGGLRLRGMFDDEGNAWPVLTVFDRFTRGKLPARAP